MLKDILPLIFDEGIEDISDCDGLRLSKDESIAVVRLVNLVPELVEALDLCKRYCQYGGGKRQDIDNLLAAAKSALGE
jgi:hypothetical protein